MRTDKKKFIFFIEFNFYNHSKLDSAIKVDVLRKYIMNRFHKTVPPSQI